VNRIWVAVVEDHPIYRDGLLQAVADTPDLELAGTAASVAEAHGLLDPGGPDVVLLDLGLPDGSGLDLLSTMRARGSLAAVVVLTMNDDPELVLSATRAGARGYLVKGAGRGEVVDAYAAPRPGGPSTTRE
jgi:DNA-binding NarL/FixJ family response regulator